MARFSIATILTFAILHKGVKGITLAEIKKGLLPSFMMACGFFTQNFGLKYTTPGNNALITGVYIILVPIFLSIIKKTKLDVKSIVAALITFLGIAILALPSFSGDKVRIGDIITFVSAIFFALHFITLDKSLQTVSSSKMTFIQLAFCSVFFALGFVIFDLKTVSEIDFSTVLPAIAYLGIFSSFIAYVVQTYAQSYINPTKVAIIMASECVFGPVLSVLFGMETATVYLIVGGLLAVTGIVIAELPNKKL